jgi:hypothetical protein
MFFNKKDKMKQARIIKVGKDFSRDPLGRFYDDSNSSGEQFREELLWPEISQLKQDEYITIILDDADGYSSSFLSEGFAGIVKYGYMQKDELHKKIRFGYTNDQYEFYEKRIIEYINESKFKSKKYKSTKNRSNYCETA